MSWDRLAKVLLAKGCSTDEVADILESKIAPVRQVTKASKKDGRLSQLSPSARDVYNSLKELGGTANASVVYANCANDLCRNSVVRHLHRLVNVYDLAESEYTGGQYVFTLTP